MIEARLRKPSSTAVGEGPAARDIVVGCAPADSVVDAARRGDRRAFGRLFEEHAAMVHGILLARVPPRDAEDLLQDVFLAALQRLETLREAAAFGAWLASFARTRVVDFHRARRPTTELPDDLAHEDPAQSEAEEVLVVIRALPEAYRETLVLRLVEGMSGARDRGPRRAHAGVRAREPAPGMKLLKEKLGSEVAMSDNWLWDRSGEPDEEVQALERKLAPARYRPRSFELPADAAPTDAVRPVRPVTLAAARVAAAVAVAALAAAVALVGRDAIAPRPLETAHKLARGPSCRGRTSRRGSPREWLRRAAPGMRGWAISDIGNVRIAPGPRLRLTEDWPSRQRLELARGEIHATVNAPPSLFVVDTPSAKAIDLGCEYTLAVDDLGDGELVVRTGWVQLEGKERYAYVPAGARAPIRRDMGPGVPHYQDAPDALREALARVERGEGVDDAVTAVVREARRKDSLTLYHLLQRVDGAHRRAVVEKLASLVPPPPGVLQARAAELDVDALEAWGNKLADTW
ncbi:MAG: sigma factor [Polyangiaceae bacterium]